MFGLHMDFFFFFLLIQAFFVSIFVTFSAFTFLSLNWREIIFFFNSANATLLFVAFILFSDIIQAFFGVSAQLYKERLTISTACVETIIKLSNFLS